MHLVELCLDHIDHFEYLDNFDYLDHLDNPNHLDNLDLKDIYGFGSFFFKILL